MVGYNPHKPGRPSHRYHSALMANTRLALGVEVMPANASAPSAQHAQDLGLARCLTGCRTSGPLARGHRLRERVRAPRGRGPKSALSHDIAAHQEHQTPGHASLRPDWEKAGLGWQGREDTLQLSGWSRPRRVIVLRRPIRGDVLIAAQDDLQLTLAFIESRATAAYEYAVLVTSTDYGILTVAQLYRDRADAENNCDELKNQWGVRPGSRLRVCFTGQGGPDETGCSINRSLPRHAEPVTARCEALGTM